MGGTGRPVQDASGTTHYEPQDGGTLSRETQRLLRLWEQGEKVDYLKIRDYVTILFKVTAEGIYELPDGSKFVQKGGSTATKPKLENITALQYMEASMRILGKLILDGSHHCYRSGRSICRVRRHDCTLRPGEGLAQCGLLQ